MEKYKEDIFKIKLEILKYLFNLKIMSEIRPSFW